VIAEHHQRSAVRRFVMVPVIRGVIVTVVFLGCFAMVMPIAVIMIVSVCVIMAVVIRRFRGCVPACGRGSGRGFRGRTPCRDDEQASYCDC